MNVIIFSLTIIAAYGIILYAYKAYQRADKAEQSDETFVDMKRKRKPIGNGFVFGEKDE